MVVRLLSLTLCLSLICAGAAAQSWQEHTSEGELAFAYGNNARAEAAFKKALENAKHFRQGDRRIETSFRNLARLYEHQSRLDEAQPLYELLLAAQEARLGKEHPALLETLLALGRTCLKAGDVASAETHLRRFLKLASTTGEATPEQQQTVLSILASMMEIQERHDEALAMQRRSVALITNELDLTATEQANELDSLAQLELLYGTPEKAEKLLLKAVTLRCADDAEISRSALLVTAAMAALAAGENEMAQRIADKALKEPDVDQLATRQVLAEAAWRSVHRGDATIEDLLAAGGDTPSLAAASQELEDVLALQQEQLDARDPQLIQTMRRCVEVSALRGELDAAITRQRQLTGLLETTPGAELDTAMADLAALYWAAGEKKQAVRTNGELLGLLEQRWGSNDDRLLPVLERQLLYTTELHQRKQARALKKRIRKLK